MPREVEPSLNEKQFVTQALQEHLRLDNRAFDEYRPIELSFGDEYGTAEVKLGKTRYESSMTYYQTQTHSNIAPFASQSPRQNFRRSHSPLSRAAL